MKMIRLTSEEASLRMDDQGLSDDIDTLIDKYGIDKAARRLNGDKTWLVASESVYGEFCGDTLTDAVHIFVLSYEANKDSLFE
jgi:dihydrofolate reductase